MHPMHWLAALPFLGLLIGPFFVNEVTPYVFGMPRLLAIPGRPLSAFEAPAGECAFAPRCPHALDVCRQARPALIALDGGLSRCVRAEELRGRLEVALHG